MNSRFDTMFGSWDSNKEVMYGLYPAPEVEEQSTADSFEENLLFTERNSGGLGHYDYGQDFDTTTAEQSKAVDEARAAVQRSFEV